jgi:hypothetical protein
MKNYPLRIPIEIYDQLVKLAKKNDRSINGQIVVAIKENIKNK